MRNKVKHTRESVIKAAQDAALAVNGYLTRAVFSRVSGIGQAQISLLFPKGGYAELLVEAGLPGHPAGSRPDRDNIIERFHELATKLGRIPNTQMMKAGGVPPITVQRKFGSLEDFLKDYGAWLESFDPSSELLEQLDNAMKNRNQQPPAQTPSNTTQDERSHITATRTTGTVFGAPINFRGLQHAPVNELGVVYLFGMVSHELGFLVEAVQAAFPDCEAKRLVDSKKGLWQRVRIEFEFRSRSFREHGHDENSCDVIVCWEHNWPDCPLEVIELKERIKGLRSSLD